jgi:hypothetical protein
LEPGRGGIEALQLGFGDLFDEVVVAEFLGVVARAGRAIEYEIDWVGVFFGRRHFVSVGFDEVFVGVFGKRFFGFFVGRD